jgi:DNA-binding XRE family transcriptional regulator
LETYKLSCRCGRTVEVTDETAHIKCKCRKNMVYTDELHPLAAYRFKYDLTQGELSALLKVDRSTLAKIETNSYSPTEEQRKQIRIITGIIV